jgi:hypothetical protein
MIELLLEGLEAALLPCSLIVLIPGVAVALAARQESTPALLGFVLGVLAFGWLRFSATVEDFARPVVAMAFAASVALLLVPLLRRIDLLALGGGVLAGGAAANLWLPCVGIEFGTLLGELPGRCPVGIILFAAYLAGMLAPLIALGAVMYLIPNPLMLPVRPFMMAIGGGTLGLLALMTLVGLDDNLVSKLVSLSV